MVSERTKAYHKNDSALSANVVLKMFLVLQMWPQNVVATGQFKR